MKKSLLICALMCLGQWVLSQDTFQELLFPADFIMSHKEAIRLNTRQEARIKSIHNENQTVFSRKRTTLNQATEQLHKLLNAEKTVEIRIGEQMDMVLSLENELKKMQLQTLLTLRNELNSNQIAALKALRQNNKASDSNFQHDEVISIRTESSTSVRPFAYFIDQQGKYLRITNFNSINLKDIASIKILKDEATIEKFGVEGTNGVIIITLKDAAPIEQQ